MYARISTIGIIGLAISLALLITQLSTFTQTQAVILEDDVSDQIFEPRNYWTVPDGIPLPTVTRFDTTAPLGEGYIFLAPYERRRGSSDYSSYLMIVDNQGELVYYYKNQATLDVHYHDFKVLPNDLLVYMQGNHRFQDSSYQSIGSITSVGLRPDFHDIELLPNGNYMLLVYSERAVDMSQIIEGGDPNAIYIDCHLQEIDPDGNLVFEWRSEDHFGITDTYKDLLASYIDGVHCNSVDVDKDGNLIISSRDLYEVTKIDRLTGQVIWRLGGKQNQFEFINAIEAEHVLFDKQHDARWVTDSNLTLFDNRVKGKYSRAVEYEIDEENMTATLVWEYRRVEDLHGSILGNTQRFPNGNTFMGWGNSLLTAVEVTQDGTPIFELYLPQETVSYRAFRFPWTGQPTTSPELVVIREIITGTNPVDTTNTIAIKLAYSWNGATEVSAYQIYGDASPFPQTLITTTPKSGFETVTILRDEPLAAALDQNYNFRVVPLDRNGEPFTIAATAVEASTLVISIEGAIVEDIVTGIATPYLTKNYFLPLIRN